MTIRTEVATNSGENVLTVSITGHFDINSYKEFRQACMARPEPISKYIIDVPDLKYMDLCALDMLLVLRKRAGGENAKIKITNCPQHIRKMLDIVDFNELLCVE